MRWSQSLGVVLALALVSPGVTAGQEGGPTRDSSYCIGPGDVLSVDAFSHAEVSGDFPIEGNGEITYPLLGEVQVAGLTTSEIAGLLVKLLEKDFYVNIQLQVEVKEYHSQPVTIVGEVLRPGTYYLRGRTTLTEILSEAGGLHPGAGSELELRRVARTGTTETQQTITYSIEDILSGDKGSEIELRPGDVVKVSAKQVYFITGEVTRPGQYESSRGLTLMQAVSQAGGLSKFASQTIEVHREAEEGKDILTFDLAQIRKGKMADPPVHQGDVIIVRRRFF